MARKNPSTLYRKELRAMSDKALKKEIIDLERYIQHYSNRWINSDWEDDPQQHPDYEWFVEYDRRYVVLFKERLEEAEKELARRGLERKKNPGKGTSVLGALILGGIIGHSMKK